MAFLSRSRIAAAVLACLLLTSACGGSDGSSDSKRSGATATGTTPAPNLPTSDGKPLSAATFFDQVLAAMAQADSTHATLKRGDTKVASAVMKFAQPLSLSMSIGVAGAGTVEMRYVAGTFYLRAKQLSGDRFAILKTDGDDQLSRVYAQLPDVLDPASQAKTYRRAQRSITQKGRPITVDGVVATPYVIVHATHKMPAFTALGKASGNTKIPDTISLTWWIGPDHLIRRSVVDSAQGLTTIEYSRWGQDVSIEKPSPDEIEDKTFQELVGQDPA